MKPSGLALHRRLKANASRLARARKATSCLVLMRPVTLAKAVLANVASVKIIPSSQTTKQQLPNALNNAFAVQGITSVGHPSHLKVFALSVRKPNFSLPTLVGCRTANRIGFALHTTTFWVPLYSTMGIAQLMVVLIPPKGAPPALRPIAVANAMLVGCWLRQSQKMGSYRGTNREVLTPRLKLGKMRRQPPPLATQAHRSGERRLRK
jgi:hypothetical protein